MSTYDDEDFTQSIDQAKIQYSLDFELMIRILNLSQEARAKMLAFLHLTDDLGHVKADLVVDANEDVSLRLFNQKGLYANYQPGHESAVEQLQ